MRISKMSCDACGRNPTVQEWMRAEFTAAGYTEWRHPGIPFKEAGMQISQENEDAWKIAWKRLFSCPIPDSLSFICPECQTRVDLDLPDMLPAIKQEVEKLQSDRMVQQVQQQATARQFFGDEE